MRYIESDVKFSFIIKGVETITEHNIITKIVTVETEIKSLDHEPIFHGPLRVKSNKFGIFPIPSDLSAAVSQASIQQKLAVELKRFIRPAKRFL
ncbi:hypothetical protein [Falsibacillus albus]|uniref:Uncharacterized protein n=1 Tax=Falsibacillus albus TaxID=2478915 RepID=A0A3L7JYA9_9BACI|nr:hypothetical protein [Falsibacillus albus]RLQ95234.1 hypothetical protein D9X91_12150 [Falsibacillus albus]